MKDVLKSVGLLCYIIRTLYVAESNTINRKTKTINSKKRRKFNTTLAKDLVYETKMIIRR